MLEIVPFRLVSSIFISISDLFCFFSRFFHFTSYTSRVFCTRSSRRGQPRSSCEDWECRLTQQLEAESAMIDTPSRRTYASRSLRKRSRDTEFRR